MQFTAGFFHYRAARVNHRVPGSLDVLRAFAARDLSSCDRAVMGRLPKRDGNHGRAGTGRVGSLLIAFYPSLQVFVSIFLPAATLQWRPLVPVQVARLFWYLNYLSRYRTFQSAY